jgi:L-iditol 2-dehydrogenase
MKCLVWYGSEGVKYEDRPVPEIQEDEILLKVAYVGICGSEMSIINGHFTHGIQPPQILGHEFSGTVAKLGNNARGFSIGERITAHPLAGCGECYFCKRAQEHFCLNPFTTITVKRAGAFAEYTPIKVKSAFKLPEWMSLKTAAMIEPISIAVHAFSLIHHKPGDTVAILGGGAIGLCCLLVAAHFGSGKIILSDPIKSRLTVAKKLGADIVVDPSSEDLEKAVMSATDGFGVDLCIEAAGREETCSQVLSVTKNAGTVLIVGVVPPSKQIPISFGEINKREISIIGSNWSPYSFDRTISLMQKLNVEPVISHEFPLSEYRKAFAIQGKEGIRTVFKVDEAAVERSK